MRTKEGRFDKIKLEKEGVRLPVNMKEAIAKAFMEISKTKSVDKITVKDLVEACHISRQTFYYHFQDILEVIEWSVEQAFEGVPECGTGLETLRTFIETSYETDVFLQKLLHSQRREQVEKIFVDAVRSYLQEMLARQEMKPDLPLADAKVMLDFCTYGIVGLLLENCGKKSLDKEKLARQMQRLISERVELLNKK